MMKSGIWHGNLVCSQKVFADSKLKTGEEKAITKADLKHRKKMESGYTTDPAARSPIIWKPVLLHKFSKHSLKIDYPCIVQPKLDGVRATWREQVLWTRGLKEYKPGTLLHIYDALRANSTGWGRMDGELYHHGTPLQDIVHATRTYDSSITPFLKFYVFDLPDNPEMPQAIFKQRLKKLLKIGREFGDLPLEVVNAHVCTCEEEVDYWYQYYIDQDYEGLIVRNMNGIYEWNKRSYDVQKKKDKLSAEFLIDGFRANNSTGQRLLEFVCKTTEGTIFKTVPAWPKEKRDLDIDRVYKDAVASIGEALQCEFRYWTKDKLPGHCVGKVVRPKDDY